MSERRPHIIIFNPDQWRGDVLGHMGNGAAVTPNLDAAVQRDAVSFRRAFCQNPVCTPSRCSFMSGWYPHVRGHRTMFHMMHPERGEPVLLKLLKDNGYFVWWGGKNDLVPGQHGYDAYCDERNRPNPPHADSHSDNAWRGDPDGDNYYSFFRGKLEKFPGEDDYLDGDWCNVRDACTQIRAWGEKQRQAKPGDAVQPLCIYLPLGYPHPPYAVEEPYFSAIDRRKLPPRLPSPDGWKNKPCILPEIQKRQRMTGWTEDRWDELRATYYGMCARVDAQFGRVLEALRDAGLYDDSAVFFFSDHGDFTGDYGLVEKTQNTLEDVLTRVPLVIKPPSWTPVRPRVSEAMVELIDFTATVLDLTGIDPGYDHFGRSLLPVLAGETDVHRDAVFCEGGRRYGEVQAMEREGSAHTDEGGLYSPRVGPQRTDERPYHSKATMCRTRDFKYVQRLYESDELYDLRSDPGELNNRIDDPALAPVLNELRLRMLRWYQETCDVVPRDADRRS